MCVIINLTANAMMPKEPFYNAVYNNWQGWGLLVKDGKGGISCEKGCPTENDPEALYALLEKYKDCQRILHVRFATKGKVDLENTQPFCVYNTDNRKVFLMHNGTLDKFAKDVWENGRRVTGDESDTKQFANMLSKALVRWDGADGKADFHDEAFRELIVDPNWSHSSKGLLVSNDLQEWMWGPNVNGWQEFKHKDHDSNGPKIWVSNNDYFDRVSRGPEDARRKKAEEDKRKEEAANSNNSFRGHNHNNGNVIDTVITNFNRNLLAKDPAILKKLDDIFSDKDLWSPEGSKFLAYVSDEEWVEYVQKEEPMCIATLFSTVLAHLWDSREEIVQLEKKLNRRHEKITELMGFGAVAEIEAMERKEQKNAA